MIVSYDEISLESSDDVLKWMYTWKILPRGISTPVAKELLARTVMRPSGPECRGMIFSGQTQHAGATSD
eukprot:scaffold69885_cov36-Cyclotella_meneghiniana.AAC.2